MYAGRPVLVAGAGVAGVAAAEALLGLGARVTVVDRTHRDALDRLSDRGARVVVADPPPADLLDGVAVVVVSPGFQPTHPLVRAAAGRRVEVFSEPELAWRLRGPGAAPWLAITGTNGKTTAVTMLAAILTAAGARTVALGNIGEPLVDAARDDRFDVLAVELSSFQLHWSSRLAPEVGGMLNLADDHLDWHGDFKAYAAAKTRVWRSAATGSGLAVGNVDDPVVEAALARIPGRCVGLTLGPPDAGQFGVVDGVLVDRTGDSPVELVKAADVRPAGAHNVANALAAAALARAYGVAADAVGRGLRGYEPQPHRNAAVATVDGVGYVDDSKATNPHAALAALRAYPRVVWIAGGQLKGVDVEELVVLVADRLVGAVLLGTDRAKLAQALTRHAPEIPVHEVTRTDDEAMGEVVQTAARLARAGDTVLLAPAAASLDMFASYAHRGRAFASAVAALRRAAE